MLVSNGGDTELKFAVIQMMNMFESHKTVPPLGMFILMQAAKNQHSWSTCSMLSRSTGQDNHTTVVSRFQAISKTLKTNKFLFQVLKHQA